MTIKDEAFLKKLLATFKIEAEEHLQLMTGGLIELEKAASGEKKRTILESIFREVHSLKGAARAVNLTPIETVCKSLESIFDSLKRETLVLRQDAFTNIHRAIDFISKSLRALEPGKEKGSKQDVYAGQSTLLKSLDEILKRGMDFDLNAESNLASREISSDSVSKSNYPLQVEDFESSTFSSDTVRIPSKKLEKLFRRAEELFTSKLSVGDIVVEMQTLQDLFEKWKLERTALNPALREIQKELRIESLDNKKGVNGKKNLSDIIEYITWNDAHLKTIERNFTAQISSAKKNYHSIDLLANELFDEMKNILMFPFSGMLEIFPKLVRDLSNAQGKDIELIVKGADIEIDRRILEELKDPFIHLIRNCIDHGIETNELRRELNKSIPGSIRITISQIESDKVEIVISDDGGGINLDKVIESSVRQKIINKEEAKDLTADRILGLIFYSGVSSSPMITDISGMGLGLAIVKEKVEKLGGAVIVETEKNVGTNFRIVVPLTLVTFHGVFISADNNILILPSSNVTQVAKITKDKIKSVENRASVKLGEEVLSLVKLSDALGIKKKKKIDEETLEEFQVVVVTDGIDKIAYKVDEVIGEKEILVKQLGKSLSQLETITGATILGNGKVVPILNIYDLLKKSVSRSLPFALNKLSELEETKRKSILVAEDSITARTLLKNILETAGYDVTTAVDGIDAFTLLKTKNFNIIISDVDMPRMSGFDLTHKIRSTKDYSELPVVLITALESREDRERGIDVGANAYIVKSSFDQNNLLEVIRQLT